MRMKILPIFLVFLFSFSLASALTVTLEAGQNDNFKVALIEDQTLTSEEGDYSYFFYDSSEKKIAEGSFNLDFYGEFVKFDTTLVSLGVDSDKVGELVIRNPSGSEVFREDIGLLACNSDGACSGFENSRLCPADCSPDAEDNYCNDDRDGYCDPDCADEVDIDCTCGDGVCSQTESYYRGSCPQDCEEIIMPSGLFTATNLMILTPIILIILLAALIYFLKFRKTGKKKK